MNAFGLLLMLLFSRRNASNDWQHDRTPEYPPLFRKYESHLRNNTYFNRLLIASLFIEVRELVGTQQHFTTRATAL
jgi:hypothetical protein